MVCVRFPKSGFTLVLVPIILSPHLITFSIDFVTCESLNISKGRWCFRNWEAIFMRNLLTIPFRRVDCWSQVCIVLWDPIAVRCSLLYVEVLLLMYTLPPQVIMGRGRASMWCRMVAQRYALPIILGTAWHSSVCCFHVKTENINQQIIIKTWL